MPVDFAGLYQLRVAPMLNPQADSEYTLRAVIEVRAGQPGHCERVDAAQSYLVVRAAKQSRCAWRCGRRMRRRQFRLHSGVAARSGTEGFRRKQKRFFASLRITSCGAMRWERLPCPPRSRELAPGRYELRAEVPGFTCVAQPIRIGSEAAARSPFSVTLHGDYDNLNSTASAWDFADAAAAMLDRSQVLGVNQYVNRTAAGRYPLAFANDATGSQLLRDLEKRLAADPAGVATQKVDFGFAQEHLLGAFGAHGIREWLLLVGMDAALPIGTSTGYAAGLKPAQYAAEITSYTQALKGLPAFAGWDWVANWWVTDANLRFTSTSQKAAYEAALKRADDSGAGTPCSTPSATAPSAGSRTRSRCSRTRCERPPPISARLPPAPTADRRSIRRRVSPTWMRWTSISKPSRFPVRTGLRMPRISTSGRASPPGYIRNCGTTAAPGSRSCRQAGWR